MHETLESRDHTALEDRSGQAAKQPREPSVTATEPLRANLIRRPSTWLVVFLALLASFRIAQAFSGHFQFADELRYLAAESLVDDLQAGQFREAAGQVFTASARPGFVLVSVIPVSMQRTAESVFHIPRGSRESYHIAAVFHVLVSLTIALTLYALARHWLSSGWGALLVTGVHALLTGSNLWIRHMVPYYESLCLMLIALMIVMRAQTSTAPARRTAVWAGVLSSLGYACYPGYYGFVIVIAAVLATVSKRRMSDLLVFGSCFAAVLLSFEVVSRWAGASYFEHMATLSRMIYFGSSEENHVFFWRYLGEVEGPVGIAIIGLVGLFGLQAWRKAAAGEWSIPGSLIVAVAAVVGAYLIHANQSIRRYPTVFNGRLMLMYMPILIVAAVAALLRIRSVGLRRVGCAGLAFASAWSFVLFAPWFARVQYPADVFLDLVEARGLGGDLPANVLWTNIGTNRDHRTSNGRPLFALVADTYPAGFTTILASHADTAKRDARIIGVNLKWIRDVPEQVDTFAVPDAYHLVAETANIWAMPAFLFEDRGPIERGRLCERRSTARIYERDDGGVTAGQRVAGGMR